MYNRRLHTEALEARNLLAVDSVIGVYPLPNSDIPSQLQVDLGTQIPIGSMPQLHSLPSATAKLVLDFDGRVEASWGARTNVVTPVLDADNDPTTFNDTELAVINEVWARVAEDYAPFNVDVTTVDTGNEFNGQTAIVAIGGSYSDWYGSPAGGVAYVGGFYNLASNVGYVFFRNLGSAKSTAEAAAHEAGHLFGLSHQASWSGSTLVSAYNYGDANWAPIMGVGYSAARTTWYNGPTEASPVAYQDDISILNGPYNGFGPRGDTVGDTINTATTLPSNFSVNGLVNSINDHDMYKFVTTGGVSSFSVAVAPIGPNLDVTVRLLNSSGNVVMSVNPTDAYSASLSPNLVAGTYYVDVTNDGVYGNIGQYTLSGTVAVAPTNMDVLVNGNVINSNTTVDFGINSINDDAINYFTISNPGIVPLNISNIQLPVGYQLVAPFTPVVLQTGNSFNFAVRLNTALLGTYTGSLVIVNDSIQPNFLVNLTGRVLGPPVLTLTWNGSPVVNGSTIDFGTINVGASADRTIVMTNNGEDDLIISGVSVDGAYSIFGSVFTTISAGQSDNFVLSLDTSSVGTWDSVLNIISNDVAAAINVHAVVVSNHLAVTNGNTPLNSGDGVHFGNADVGATNVVALTIANNGVVDLNIYDIAVSDGFFLTTPFVPTVLHGGESVVVQVQLDTSVSGLFTGTVSISSDDLDAPEFIVNLDGKVLIPASMVVSTPNGTLDNLTPYDFGTVAQNSVVTQAFTVTNSGESDLIISSVQSSNNVAVTGAATILGAGQSVVLNLQINTASVGSFSGSMTIVTNVATFTTPILANVVGSEITVLVGTQSLASNATVDFGTVVQGANTTKTFTIRNDGLTSLVVSSIVLPAQFSTTSSINNLTIAAGQSVSVIVKIDSSVAGPINGQMVINSNDSDEATFVVNLTGVVTSPEISVIVDGSNLASGDLVDFGSLPLNGASTIKTFTIRNDGNANLTITKLTLPARYDLVQGLTQTNLAPGATASFGVRLQTKTGGTFTGQIIIGSNDSDEANFNINVTGSVLGTEITVLDGSTAISSGAVIDFGSQPISAVARKTLTIRNDGLAVLNLTGINVPVGFKLIQAPVGKLSPGATTSLIIGLDTKRVGTYSGTVIVKSNDSDEGQFLLNVRGTVVGAKVTLLQGSLPVSGSVAMQGSVGNVITQTFTVRNDGLTNLTVSKITVPTGFKIVSALQKTTLGAGETGNFTVQLMATKPGVKTGLMVITSNSQTQRQLLVNMVGSIVATQNAI